MADVPDDGLLTPDKAERFRELLNDQSLTPMRFVELPIQEDPMSDEESICPTCGEPADMHEMGEAPGRVFVRGGTLEPCEDLSEDIEPPPDFVPPIVVAGGEDALHAARCFLCNAIDTLARGVAGVGGTAGLGTREALLSDIRCAEQHLGHARRTLDAYEGRKRQAAAKVRAALFGDPK